MSYRITVEEIVPAEAPGADVVIARYIQQVDELDLRAVINAVMHKPRKPRERKAKVVA